MKVNYVLNHFTFSHHNELHLLLHGDVFIVLCQEKRAVNGAAVCPRVIEGDIMHVNGSYLNISVHWPMPLQAVDEVFMEDVSAGVVVVEYLMGREE